MRRWTIAAAALALLVPAGLRGQDEWERQVREQLEAGGGVYRDRGYELTHRVYVGSLNNGAQEGIDLDLDEGWDYAIMGACDTDCSDLDLVLFSGRDEID